MLGDDSDAVWWGNTWAATGLVFVSFNYRLGALGFFGSDALNATNFGFLDQQQVLRWVQSNIAGFGGDKSRVTIFGQVGAARLLLFFPLSSVELCVCDFV